MKRHHRRSAERPTRIVRHGVTRASRVGVGIFDETGQLLGWGLNETAAWAACQIQ